MKIIKSPKKGQLLFLNSARAVLTSQAWWRQQQWVLMTEILMGFFAAWGLTLGHSVSYVAVAVGSIYFLQACGFILIHRYGRRGAVALGGFVYLMLLAAVFFPFEGVAAGLGALLAFRDKQSVHSLSWMPVQARRKGGDNLSALLAGSLFGGIFLFLGLFLSGFILRHWPHYPQVIMMVLAGALMPLQIMRTRRCYKVIRQSKVQNRQKTSWLLWVGFLFNSAGFLGRRLLLPIVMLSLAKKWNIESSGLVFLGGVLGGMGLLSTLIRSKIDQSKALMIGLRASIFGWIFIGAGVWLSGFWSGALLLFFGGWVLLELSSKTWTAGYLEALRQAAGRSRGHRKALGRFMVMKSMGGAVGCFSAASGAPPAVLVIFLAGASLFLLERGRTERLR